MMHQTSCYMYLVALAFYLSTWKCAAADEPYIILPVRGNVYPDEQYNVTIFIGDPPLPYTFDIDTGSDVIWVQCDAPCVNCYQGPHPPYKKEPSDIVRRDDPICVALQHLLIPGDNDQCHYLVDYADGASSLGVLVRDDFKLTFNNGSSTTQQIAFGCGYDQIVGHKGVLVDGILGLGKGGSTILAQLEKKGITRNFVGHCFNSAGGGYLVIGAVPLIGIQWKKITGTGANHYYSLGVADILFDWQPTDINGLQVLFDSGSTYTYIPNIEYARLLSLIVENLDLERAPGDTDKGLSMCWKSGNSGFRSIRDAASHFKTLALNFRDRDHGTEIEFVMPPTSYIVLTDTGSACLGILNGTQHNLEAITLIGDISMQDKLVLYDNNNNQVGWAAASCSNTH